MSSSGFDCLDCGGFIFRPGPCGGLAQNLECVSCGQRFNVAHWGGLMISIERISNDSSWCEDMFPKVLE